MSYILPAVGAALTYVLIMRVMDAMRFVSSAGLSAVTAGLSEASLPALVSLYTAIVCGVAGIIVAAVRLKVPTNTVSPSPWFFIISGGLCLIPVALLWQAESVLISALISTPISGLAQAASTIELLLTLTPIVAAVSILLSLTGSVLPVSSRSKPKWGPVITLVVIEMVLVFVAVAFQIRISWLHQVAVGGRM